MPHLFEIYPNENLQNLLQQHDFNLKSKCTAVYTNPESSEHWQEYGFMNTLAKREVILTEARVYVIGMLVLS